MQYGATGRMAAMAGVLWLAAAGAGAGEVVNPLLEKFADAVTFYVNFDNGDATPVIAAGKADIRTKQHEPKFVPGLFGQALTGGNYFYNGGDNVDLAAPGTALAWVSMRGREAEEPKKEGNFWPLRFQPAGVPMGRELILFGRMAGPRIYMYVYAPLGEDGKTPAPGKANFIHSIPGGGFKEWGEGWHLIALTWGPDKVGLSVDGAPLDEKALPEPMNANIDSFILGLKDDVVDEVAILNRRLTSEELKSLYDETVARAKAATP